MWSDWLVFCDCGFQSVCLLMEKDKRLMEASWWEKLTERETGSCSEKTLAWLDRHLPAKYSTLLFHLHQEALSFLFTFCHKRGGICISEFDISPSNLDSSMCFIQSDILHDVLCIEVKLVVWQYTALTYSFPSLEAVYCFMSGSNCCFLTWVQVS